MGEEDNRAVSGSKPGSYEVWFVTFTDPESGRGYWIRSTLLAPNEGPPSAGVWFAAFDPADPGATTGIHATSRTWRASPEIFDVEVGPGSGGAHAIMRSGVATGSVAGGGRSAAWDLTYETGDPTYRLLPRALYRGSVAPTKPLSPNVDTRLSGTVTLDGNEVRLDGVPAQQGHLVGSRHAERWAWAHCSSFVDEDAVLHAVTAQGRRGPLTLPFLTFVGLRWRGKWIRLSKVSRRRDFGLGMWRVSLENRRYRLTGRVEAPARAMLRARYEDPSGEPRYCHNSEISSCRLALFERRGASFEEVALLESQGTTHAEWAGRTPAAAVEREFVEVDEEGEATAASSPDVAG